MCYITKRYTTKRYTNMCYITIGSITNRHTTKRYTTIGSITHRYMKHRAKNFYIKEVVKKKMITISKRGAGKSNIPPYDESITGWIKKYLKIYESGYYDSATLSRVQLVKNYELVQLLDKQLDWLVKFYKVNKNELSREALLEIASEISIIINKVEDINNGKY